jgi:4,5-dihydroxyphthalate decarboxylase
MRQSTPTSLLRLRRATRGSADWGPVEQDYYKQTGIFPISHAVTFRQEFVDAHPDAPVALLKAYRTARDIAFTNVEGSDPQVLVVSWITAAMAKQRELMGDTYWAYNLTEPHNVRSLEAITEFAYQQGLTPTRLDYHTFFHPEAAALSGY